MSPFRDLLTAPRHFLLNVAALIPFGFFLPLLYKSFRNGKIVAIIGFLFSLCIEVVQMFGWGVSELDDLIANTLGVFLGYCFYGQIRYIHRKDAFKAIQSVSVNDSAQLFFFFAGSFIIMIHV